MKSVVHQYYNHLQDISVVLAAANQSNLLYFPCLYTEVLDVLLKTEETGTMSMLNRYEC